MKAFMTISLILKNPDPKIKILKFSVIIQKAETNAFRLLNYIKEDVESSANSVLKVEILPKNPAKFSFVEDKIFTHVFLDWVEMEVNQTAIVLNR